MRIVIYNSPCAPGLAGPLQALTGLCGAIFCETATRTGRGPDKASGGMEIARGIVPPGGVLCVCGKELAR
jgi:hypothetical protein